MDIVKRDQFIALWKKYFNDAELPVAFYYSKENNNATIVKKAMGHTCIIAQLGRVRKGESLCFLPDSVGCGGGKFYLGFSKSMREGFEYFLSHGENTPHCERYKRTPEQVNAFLKTIHELPRKGDCLVFKRWDHLTEQDEPEAVFFFAPADVISGLFTLAGFDSSKQEAVISPFGAGCTSIIYYPYREQIEGTKRAVLGMFDPSARLCTGNNLLSFAVPISKFMEMIDQMEESFLITNTWKMMQKRM
ncbi:MULTISPECIES: DUF169 domain-containing protein [unclassified Butyricimonas]|jgi:hypothetical protein bfra3_10202|uniref:DUF169 domain-containing protein n=1 Tax=unclassified Butyricimonas TaxID=2637652 RepID=UPI000B38F490|nr:MULTISPECIES: DUF169 domain-containing protein [unclassified Butyricimonas]OUN64856.1 hypothetical protein B5G13_09460 [Butyricimonas sp. An62]